MKKSLVALAALAVVSAASAQSSVTLWGVVDASIANAKQNGVSKTYMSSSGLSSSQLGFRGTEDLGGGMSASFWLESQLVNDTGAGGTGGALSFNRRSTIDVAGGFGAIRMGRDYTPSFWNHTVFDPFGTLGSGAGSNITIGLGGNGAGGENPGTAARTNNGLSYLYGIAPNGGSHGLGSNGIYAQLTYAFAENASNLPANGKYTGGRVGYAMGPINAAVSYAESVNNRFVASGTTFAAALGTSITYKAFNLAGSYDLGVAKLMAHIGTNDSSDAGTKQSHWGIGAQVPMGAGYIPVSYNVVKQDNAASTGANQLAVGYVYNLSKRSALYTTYSKLSNKNGGVYTLLGGNGGHNPGIGGATTSGSATGMEFGVKHSF
jgi:predicted porin